MINSHKKLWRWGPIDGRPIYPDPWYDGMTFNLKQYKPGWPESYSLYKRDRYSFVCEFEPLYRNAEKIFIKYILNSRSLKRTYKRWSNIANKLQCLNNTITSDCLINLNNKELYSLIKTWYKIYSHEFWGVGLVPEIANFGGEKLLKNIIEKNKVTIVQKVELMERLSAPDKLSFYAKEEISLLKLKRLKGNGLVEALKKHQRKYFWIFNSYHDTKVLSVKTFLQRLRKVTRAEARRRLTELKNQSKQVKALKKKLVKQYGLGNQALNITTNLSYCIWWQDKRKSYIFQANHIIGVLLNELSRRYGIGLNDLHYYVFKDLFKLIKSNKKLSSQELKNRQSYFAIVWSKKGITKYLSGAAAKKLYVEFNQPILKINNKVIYGEVVSSGIVRGRVRIIVSARNSNQLKKGEILVTKMTSPDFVVAIKKSAAVVTDVGGITSHAAIVSRELKIPCVVGTNVATRILKTGDMVEVNGSTGEVKKL